MEQISKKEINQTSTIINQQSFLNSYLFSVNK